MKPIFILGMGAQKAGTSWLHRMLAQQDNVNLGFTKEYHIWDYIYSDLCNNFRAPVKKPDNAHAAMRRMMQASSETYTQYFQGLLNSDVNVTGDITPSYSIINELGLEKISRTIKGAGFDIKVIFLMRDPVERIWSAVRMEQRNRLKNGQTLNENFCDSRVKEYLNIDGHVARSDYKTTVRNIAKVFNEGEIYFGFYESLFNEQSINGLQDFLGFNLKNVDFSERVNASDPALMSEGTTQLLTEFLAPQYEFCKERFEAEGLHELWPSHRWRTRRDRIPDQL
jgi:hypothetical protein